MDAAEFEAAGLCDLKAPDATGRLKLPECLASQGATIEQIVYAAREASPPGLAGDLALRPAMRLTPG